MILKLGTTSPEVAKWQAFLGLLPSGIFNDETVQATKEWQRSHGLDDDGMVGPDTMAAAATEGYTRPTNDYYPPRPPFHSPTADERDRMFGKFAYRRKNDTDIVITDDWASKNIIQVKIPQLIGVSGAPPSGIVQFHRKGADQLKAFFAEVESAGMLSLVISWAGSFYPRFIRGSQRTLSNHSWGTAFDINAPENWLNQKPAAVGKKGSLLKLVPIANKHGFFWGGHYNTRLDGMHFELAKITDFSTLTEDEIILDLPNSEPTTPTDRGTQPTAPSGTTLENPLGLSSTPSAAPLNQPVEVQKESPSWMVKIAAPFTALAGLGINAGSLVQTKLEQMTTQQIVYMLAALGLVALAVWWWTKAAKAAQMRTMELVKNAADPTTNTVVLKK